MAALAAAKGAAFDRQFLDLMIAHHRGAVDMVERSSSSPAPPTTRCCSSSSPTSATSRPPRSSAWTRCATPSPATRASSSSRLHQCRRGDLQPRQARFAAPPAGFFDPANPADLPLPKAKKGAKPGAAPTAGDTKAKDVDWSERSPLFSFAQTDMAFSGDRLFVGNYHGFNVYRLDPAGLPVRSARWSARAGRATSRSSATSC
jgi:hypothetical protein